ncbi:cytochrome P450 [Aureobasidium subglaciale]|nr:cytochrome P450 [Aureobasidium subglaciale]KAI5213326.1 cytochrome P450 [Aureobasidium subglaciale]KAI5214711.1 cytochrome P450 [Aureobasidium subglaciale]KAI5252726.1 cytochrome P450 [Aureobasidium subglaciale]
MFDYVSFILSATFTPILVNIAFHQPYSWFQTISLAGVLAVISSICALIDAMFLRLFFSSDLHNLPTAIQGPVWKRLFREPTGDRLSQFMPEAPTSQIIRYFGVLNSERLLLTDPKDIKQVMDSQAYEFGRSYLIRRLLSPILGKNSLVVSDGADHMRCRKDVDPDFYSQHVAELCPNACSLVEAITAHKGSAEQQAYGSEDSVEILKWLEKTTFQIVFTAFFGTTSTNEQGPLEDLLQEFREAFSISSGLYAQAEMAWETILPSHLFFGLIPLDDIRKTRKSMQIIRAFCQSQITLRKSKNTPESRMLLDKNILDTVIRSENLSDEEILEMCTTFLATGYKTVSIAVAWAIYHLSIRPGVQALLRAEVRKSFPAPDRAGTPSFRPDTLQRMPILTAVFNETLRFSPLVHLTYREARTDMILPGSNQVIPEGTILAISPWAIQRSPVYWRGGEPSIGFSSTSHTACPSPLTWDISRWLSDKKGGARMQCSFMPFGRGPRCCIAEDFARDEMAVLLAVLVARFDFSFRSSGRDSNPKPEDLRTSFGVAAKPVRLMVRAQPVFGW